MWNHVFLLYFFLLNIFTLLTFSTKEGRPNVLILLADDWGFNDVGWHKYTTTQTPFLDNLVATESLNINHHYSALLCTPGRCSLLTGRYPFRYGVTGANLEATGYYALSIYETLMFEAFNDHGYNSYSIGKWHLGFFHEHYAPWNRGATLFQGYLNGKVDYYTHVASDGALGGYDLRTNDLDMTNFTGIYNPYIERDTILNIIEYHEKHPQDGPFFIYGAFQLGHTPDNETNPECEEEYYQLYENETYSDLRKCMQAQVTTMNDVTKLYVNNLKQRNLWDNTIILFLSDNGGDYKVGDSAPLRGYKSTLWEGGSRTFAFLTGGYLPNQLKGETWNYPVHITDWFPTLLSIANIDQEIDPLFLNSLDGENQWKKFLNYFDMKKQNLPINENQFLHKEFIYYIENENCGIDVCGALYYDGFKMLHSDQYIRQEHECGWFRNYTTDNTSDILNCGAVPSDIDENCTACEGQYCVFDIMNDPCEYYHIESEIEDDFFLTLYDRLLAYNFASLPSLSIYGEVNDSIADPSNHNGFWSPWADDEMLFFEDGLIQNRTTIYTQLEIYYYHSISNVTNNSISLATLYIDLMDKVYPYKYLKQNEPFYQTFLKKQTLLKQHLNNEIQNYYLQMKTQQNHFILFKKSENNFDLIVIMMIGIMMTCLLMMVYYFYNSYYLQYHPINDYYEKIPEM